MCKLIYARGLPNTNLHVKGYVEDFRHEFELYGEISNFSIAENLEILSPSIGLIISNNKGYLQFKFKKVFQ